MHERFFRTSKSSSSSIYHVFGLHMHYKELERFRILPGMMTKFVQISSVRCVAVSKSAFTYRGLTANVTEMERSRATQVWTHDPTSIMNQRYG
jgi:hypothetical protein